MAKRKRTKKVVKKPKKVRRLAYTREPQLHLERYVVESRVKKGPGEWKTRYLYALNGKHQRELILKQPSKALIKVFRVRHDFIAAYERT